MAIPVDPGRVPGWPGSRPPALRSGRSRPTGATGAATPAAGLVVALPVRQAAADEDVGGRERQGPVATTVVRNQQVLAAYGLRRPDLAEARRAIERVCGDRADQIWEAALRRCPGDPGSPPPLAAVIDALVGLGDPVVALCARALAIRLSSFEHLAATHDLVRSADA